MSVDALCIFWRFQAFEIWPPPRMKARPRCCPGRAAAGAVGLWANPLLANDGPKRRPNVLVYLVCSLRPDHTSLYGYSRDTTPFLKKLGAAGVVFDEAQAQAAWTKASVPSLMTSLYSYTHGLQQDNDTIPPGSTTLAEQLRAAGYVTASVVTNPFVGRVSGLDRGFDYLMEYPVVHRQRTDEADRGTDSAALNKVIMPWLEQHRDEPFFLYAHTTDPHAPFRPPKGYEEKWANPAETKQFDGNYRMAFDKRQYGGGAVFTRASIRARGHTSIPRARAAFCTTWSSVTVWCREPT